MARWLEGLGARVTLRGPLHVSRNDLPTSMSPKPLRPARPSACIRPRLSYMPRLTSWKEHLRFAQTRPFSHARGAPPIVARAVAAHRRTSR